MDSGQPPHQRYDYLLLQVGSIPVDPDFSIDRSAEHRCASVLVWPKGEQPSRHNTVLTDPCFTDRGFRHAKAHLNRLGLAFRDIGRIFVTHRHGDHVLSLPDRTVRLDFARFRPGVTGPLAGISTVPCPGHRPELQALVFRSSTGQKVWIVGDAIINLEWLRAWAFWPANYTTAEIIQTWTTVARILSLADLMVPGHSAPVAIDASLIGELLSTFPAAAHANRCDHVTQLLGERLDQLQAVMRPGVARS
jgi:glyoxylase-like metal-dependent hydrolase (beta-lactamase superfamily II)